MRLAKRNWGTSNKVRRDSSLLVRLYLHDSKSASIERFLADGAKVVSLSDLGCVEVLNVLLRL
jgi:predicted nucleic acid-binding protein